MSALLVAAVLSMAPAEEPAKQADVSGSWLIVYAEEQGRRVQKWEQTKATLKDGAFTYERDGKDFTFNLKFGPQQTVKASVAGKDKAAEGVCIVGQDYLCLSLSGGPFAAGDAKTDKPKADEKPGKSSGDFILILRKQREAKQ